MSNQKIEPLKPCPFCGGEASIVRYPFDCYIHCKECNASTMKFYSSEKKAIEAWNGRMTE